jgi:hypothetical protein
MRTFVLASALAVSAIAAMAPRASAQPLPQLPQLANRDGFTFELNLGAGITVASAKDAGSESYGSLGGLDLALGGFINRDTALMLRIAGTTAFVSNPNVVGDDTTVTHAFFGPAVQVWSDHVFFGGGLGLAALQGHANGEDSKVESGFGIDGRIGYELSESAHSAWSISAEVNEGLFKEGNVTSLALLFGWQYI